MFGLGKGLSEAEKKAAKKAGEKFANDFIKFMTPDKKSRPKPGYKHNHK